jgi:putative DNA primase/helicase
MTDLFLNQPSSSATSQPDDTTPSTPSTPSAPTIERRIQYFLDKYDSSLSDYGNAQRFVQHFGPEWGWLLFDGTRWRPDTSRQLLALAASSIHSLYDDVRTFTNKQGDLCERILKHAQHSLSTPHLAQLLDLATTFPGILLHPSDFDSDPYLLTVLNGTLDLRTATLLPHQPDHYITRLVPVSYDPQAHSQSWDGFLTGLTDHSPTLQHFLQRALGYSLTGLTDEGSCFLLTGPGERAQELLLSTLRTLFGSYASHSLSLRPKSLTPSLLTSRFLTTNSETLFSPAHFAAFGSLLKAQPIVPLTASPTPYDNPLSPSCKLWLSTPDPSDFPTALSHLRARVKLIPISLQLSDQEAALLTSQLQAALPAILAWAVQGALLFPAHGLQPAPDLTLASPTTMDNQDDLSSFLELCCNREDPALTVRANELYRAYVLWSRAQSITILSESAFGRLLYARNFRRTRDTAGRLYHGLTLAHEKLSAQLRNSPLSPKLST